MFNHLTGRPLDYGIKDYDLGYFDASDLSYDAEDAVIRRVKAAFDEPLRSMVEVRNQARVHLWFEAKFSEPLTLIQNWTARDPERMTRLQREADVLSALNYPEVQCEDLREESRTGLARGALSADIASHSGRFRGCRQGLRFRAGRPEFSA